MSLLGVNGLNWSNDAPHVQGGLVSSIPHYHLEGEIKVTLLFQKNIGVCKHQWNGRSSHGFFRERTFRPTIMAQTVFIICAVSSMLIK